MLDGTIAARNAALALIHMGHERLSAAPNRPGQANALLFDRQPIDADVPKPIGDDRGSRPIALYQGEADFETWVEGERRDMLRDAALCLSRNDF